MNIFLGAIMIIGCQLCMISLIIYFELTSPDFNIVPSSSFVIILARFLSSVMMHLNVEPEIRAGLILAKFCLNHPNRLKGAYERGPYGEEIINYSRILPPFFLAMSQVIVGLIVEINVLIYLTSLDNLIAVILRFVTLAAICKFDDMYAASLYENKMKAAAGKKLTKFYFRHHEQILKKYLAEGHDFKKRAMLSEGYEYIEDAKDVVDPLGYNTPYGEYQGKSFYLNPRRNSTILKFMRGIVKFFRFLYVCLIYYFMPFVFIFITFLGGLPLFKPDFNDNNNNLH